MAAPYRPTMVPNVPPRASMAPTLQAVDRLVTSYNRGHDEGFEAGKRHAYRRMQWALALAALCAGIAWMVV